MVLVLITIASLVFAVVMGYLMRQMRREEQRRFDRRVATLSADIHADDLPFEPSTTPAVAMAATRMFQIPGSTGGRFLQAKTAPLAALVLAGAGMVVFVIGGRPGAALERADRTRASQADSRRAAQPVPLELVALQHEREGEQLTIRGVVRNPATGVSIDHLAAIVLLLNADGDLITRGRAAVAAESLPPGAETTFVVTVPNSADVGRYRLSFRTNDRVIPHVDRRT
jgi:hypothetical protein